MKRGVALVCGGLILQLAFGAALAQKAPTSGKGSNSKNVEQSKEAAGALDPQVAIQMANDFFNSAQVMTADFVQVGADGRRAEGKLYVAKPGRLRFEYAEPATMEIIADGTSVVVRDRKLRTQEIYFIGQTPLKFLLKSNINLQRDVKILSVAQEKAFTIITVEDSATFGGTSTIKLFFDAKSFSLKQWQVTDPQGYQTFVTIHNLDLSTAPDAALFKIPSEAPWGSQN